MSWWALVMPAHRYPLDDLAGRRVYGLPPGAAGVVTVADCREPLRLDAVAMAATCPQIVFDDNLEVFVIVHPGDRVEDLAADWPW